MHHRAMRYPMTKFSFMLSLSVLISYPPQCLLLSSFPFSAVPFFHPCSPYLMNQPHHIIPPKPLFSPHPSTPPHLLFPPTSPLLSPHLSFSHLTGMTSNVPEVQELAGELAKKVSSSNADLNPEQIGRVRTTLSLNLFFTYYLTYTYSFTFSFTYSLNPIYHPFLTLTTLFSFSVYSVCKDCLPPPPSLKRVR